MGERKYLQLLKKKKGRGEKKYLKLLKKKKKQEYHPLRIESSNTSY